MTAIKIKELNQIKKFFIPIFNFSVNNDRLLAYTDGSCIRNGKASALSSIGVHFPDHAEL